MRKYYIIQGLISQGYWCSSTNTFRGVIFATEYPTNSLASSINDDLQQAIKNEPCTIIEVYHKFGK